MSLITPNFTVTDHGLARLQTEIDNLRRQTDAMVEDAKTHIRNREASDPHYTDNILQQERLFGRLIEMQWLVQHVRPVHSPALPYHRHGSFHHA